MGKFVEHFKAAAIASDAKSLDPVLRVTTIGRQLGYAGYMLFDNAVVVSLALPYRVRVEMRELDRAQFGSYIFSGDNEQ